MLKKNQVVQFSGITLDEDGQSIQLTHRSGCLHIPKNFGFSVNPKPQSRSKSKPKRPASKPKRASSKKPKSKSKPKAKAKSEKSWSARLLKKWSFLKKYDLSLDEQSGSKRHLVAVPVASSSYQEVPFKDLQKYLKKKSKMNKKFLIRGEIKKVGNQKSEEAL